MSDIVERLRTTGETRRRATPVDDPKQYMNVYARLSREDGVLMCEAADENDRLREALEQLVTWSEAYPLDIFPEPDLKRAHEVLTAHGMTLDALSAKAARHVIEGVGKIARAALAKEVGK